MDNNIFENKLNSYIFLYINIEKISIFFYFFMSLAYIRSKFIQTNIKKYRKINAYY